MEGHEPTNAPSRRLLDAVEDLRKARRRTPRPWKEQKLRQSLEGVHEALGELGVTLGELCGWVYGPDEGRPRPEPFLEHLERRVERTVLLGRVDRILRQASHPDVAPRAGFRQRLDAIDELRFSSPCRALPQTRQVLDEVVREVELGRESAVTLCDVLTQTGSVECALGDYPEAAACLRRGLTLSRQLALPAREASIMRLCASLVANFGDYRAALGLADEARRLSSLIHDLPGIGEALFVRGMMLRWLGDFGETVRCYEGALCYLPPEAWQHRCAVYQSLAFVQLSRGELDWNLSPRRTALRRSSSAIS